MNFSKLLIHWLKLSVLLFLLVASHVTLDRNGAEFLARSTAGAISHSQAEVEEQLQRMLARHAWVAAAGSTADLSTSDRDSCNGYEDQSSDLISDYYNRNRYDCLQAKLRELKLHPPTITDAKAVLKEKYQNEVVYPRARSIRDYGLPWGFGILYALVAFSALRALWQWFTSSVFPALSRNIEQSPLLGQLAPSNISKTAQNWMGDRAYRKAAEEVMHLDTLHKNGLISDEVFHLRKSELAARLGSHINSLSGK